MADLFAAEDLPRPGETAGPGANAPLADRLRVVSSTGQSLRINVDSGATTTDGAINGGAANASVTASAYTNSFAGTGSTRSPKRISSDSSGA